ncbi:hypothetical protein N656DRAFT_829525 [Canariomyces notabilis]|uniref:Pre-mRNA-splicing factor CWC26 n=1 Tax=Canariomyces notabilis TaxID=2074819 RepID=A0AAN6TDQ0_9PEZI|nr:hypothetical protein N656DRAFT_829525 [Canariomyces arenarius]
MPSDKAAYLAAHYLTAETKPSSSSSKKRKRKATTNSSGLLITDDDETGWGSSARPDADEDDDAPIAVVAGSTSDFRRAKTSNWKTVGTSALASASRQTPGTQQDADAAAAADAIIASAAAESAAAAAREEAEDLLPPNATSTTTTTTPMMSNGTQAGLQSAKALTAQLRARQEQEREELAQLQAERRKQQQQQEADQDGETVVLRDATGRRVDVAMRRAEARRQAAEAARAEEERKRLLTGEVQLAAARERKERLADAALMPLARGADDAALNEDLKRTERWHDPMAEFLGASGGGGEENSGRGVAKRGQTMRRPVYKGAAPPNRYGIRPGYRWDGVDRGNGFEAERFKAINRRERNKGLEYAWQMDE